MKKALAIVISAMTFIAAAPSYASVQVAGTRVIFDGAKKEQTVRISNTGKSPLLAQIWLDTGKTTEGGLPLAGEDETPFVITPPVARINGEKSQVIRIFQTAETAALPKDRESVFWLNVLEVPTKAKPKAKEKSQAEAEDAGSSNNQLSIALRTRLKMFYRPSGFKADVIAASDELKWKLRKEGNEYVVVCDNPSPVHISFGQMHLKSGDQSAELAGGMVAPMSTEQFRFSADHLPAGGPLTLKFDYITYLGAFVPKQVDLRQGD